MSKSNKIYEATMASIKAHALEAYATIETILENPAMLADHTNLVEEIVNQTATLAKYETAGLVLHRHFGPQQDKPPAAPQKGDLYEGTPNRGPLNPFQRMPPNLKAPAANAPAPKNTKAPPKNKKAQK